MHCEDIRAQLAEHLAGSLPPAAAEPFAAHLRLCRTCREEVDELQDTWRTLGDVPAPRLDAAALRARVAGAVAGYTAALHDARRPSLVARISALSRLRWSPPPAAQAVLASALVLLGLLLGWHARPAPAPDPQIAALREELRETRQLVTLSLLQQQSASERLTGITWTGRIDRPGTEIVSALLDTLAYDANVNVRLASIDALRRFADQEIVRQGAVEALTRQTSPLVQIALIDFMVEVDAPEATATLLRLSEDATVDDAVRMRAVWGLEQLG